MIILAINCGSSTLKFKAIDFQNKEKNILKESQIVSGIVDRIGGQGTIRVLAENKMSHQDFVMVNDHGEAMKSVLERIESPKILESLEICGVGHRVVHGAENFIEPTLINDRVIDRIESLNYLAPLHNPPSIKAIRAARSILGINVPQVIIFDTAFHHFLPEWASKYAIPPEIAEKYHIRRYGFHGIAHRYMTERFSSLTSIPLNQIQVITLQLGNGCSVTAIKNGVSVDTSMGFTPLEGLIMGTRAGDMDPSIVSFLMRQEGISIDDIEDWLNKRSGLLGISGLSKDMRELLKAEEEGDERSALAVNMFCYRVRKYIGAYLAVVGEAQALIFGGGIGENAPGIRTRICEGLDWCGLTLDSDLNKNTIGIEGRISKEASKIQAYVIPVDETIIIAKETVRCLIKLAYGE